MNKNQDGLNFVPFLARSPMNKGGRGKKRRSKKSSKKHGKTNINGNYEGDATMFSGFERSPLQLVDSDSDKEHNVEKNMYQYVEYYDTNITPGRRLWKHFRNKVLTGPRLEKIMLFADRVHDNFFYKQFWKLVWGSFSLLLIILRWLLLMMAYLSNLTYVLWRVKSILRYSARRLLWKMTLAKFNDTPFFGFIVLLTPFVFIISTIGFILSVYCALKDWMNRSEYNLRGRKF